MIVVTLARKPLEGKTVAANVLTHGTGGINVDGCRVGDRIVPAVDRRADGADGSRVVLGEFGGGFYCGGQVGRFPANLILCADGVLPEPVGEFFKTLGPGLS